MSQPIQLAAVAERVNALRESGDTAGARAVLDQALDVAVPTLGEDHPDVLQAVQLLATLHREAGDAPGARRVLEDALAVGEHRWSHSHPLLLAISFDLGGVAEELGNRHEARRNFGRVANLGPAVLGEDHWMVRAARDYLGPEAPQVPIVTGVYAIGAETQVAAPPHPAAPPPAPGEPIPAPQPAWAPPAAETPPPRPISRPAPPLPTIPQYDEPPRSRPPQEPTTFRRTEPVRRSRGATVAAMVAAFAATVAAVLATVAVMRSGGSDGGGTGGTQAGGTTATTPAEPPQRVQITELGDAIRVTWVDPADGRVAFMVTGGRKGEALKLMAQLDPGTTRYTVNGLNPQLDYCFVVLAAYSVDQVAASEQVCTARTAASVSPTPS